MRADSRGRGAALPHGVVVAVAATVVGAAVVTGAFERWWVAAHPIGALTSDGAVIGLMGMQLLHHGQLTAYMWGQAYAGSLEAVLTAGVFAVTGTGTGQLVATTALSSALAALALWRAGRWIVGDPAAGIAALAFWVWPAAFVWRAVKPGGTYMLGLAVALCAVGALARLRRGEAAWWRVAIAGGWCGLAFWQSPMSLQVLVPALVWCLPCLWRLRSKLAWLLAGGVVGALPVLWFGATHQWTNLRLPGPSDPFAAVPSHLLHFFEQEAPIVTGLRLESSLHWVGGWFGVVGVVGAGVGFLAVTLHVLRRSGRLVLPVLTLWILPVLYAFNPLTSRSPAGRYAMFGATLGCLLVGAGLENLGSLVARVWRRLGRRASGTVWLWPAGLAALAAIGIIGLQDLPRQLVTFGAPDVALPLDDSGLQSLVRTHHVGYAFAQYWVAYRVTFDTRQAVIASPYDYDRYPPFGARVALSPHPAWLFVTASMTRLNFEKWCSAHNISYGEWSEGGFSVVQPSSRVLPGELPHSVLYPS